MKKQILLIFIGFSITACASDYYYEYGKKIELTKSYEPYEQRALNDNNIEYYTSKSGYKVGVNKEIIVQCKENIDCRSILSKYSLKDISKLSDKLFVVKIHDDENVFEFSQKLYHDNSIKLAQPNFIKNIEIR